jgi:hypothetical protein
MHNEPPQLEQLVIFIVQRILREFEDEQTSPLSKF